MNLLFKLSYLNSNFKLTLGYLNPALNNSAQGSNLKVAGYFSRLPERNENKFLPVVGCYLDCE